MKLPDADPLTPDYERELLDNAQREFAVFYEAAPAEEAAAMHALVLAWAALRFAIAAPRGPHGPARDVFERATDATERVFMHLRDAVRATPTFQRLPAGEQRRVAGVLFGITE